MNCSPFVDTRDLELLAAQFPRVKRVLRSFDRQDKKTAEKVKTFTEEEQVWVAKEKNCSAVKLHAFESNCNGRFKEVIANHPL